MRRPQMLASAIREIIAPVVQRCPPQCAVVSITGIAVSADFSHATVSVSALREPERALRFLEAESARLQRQLSALRRKHIPMLRFRIDPRGERGDRIDRLLGSS